MSGKYGVILADPPWHYNNGASGGLDDYGAAAGQYPTMKVNDICRLPVADLAAKDAVLLEWCTWPQLQEGQQVMEAWGFKYITGFPWIKIKSVSPDLWGAIQLTVPYGVGFWARGASEFVLIGRRGSPSPPPNGFIGLLSPNLQHSRKPNSLYEYAEALPGPYLELFARRPRPGWSVWGNEVESDVTLPLFGGAR